MKITHKRKNISRLRRSRSFIGRLYESAIVRSWWMLVFLAFCYGFYWNGMHKKNLEEKELRLRLTQFEEKRFSALGVREDLLLQIESQKDPAYIEMLLMKELGVVPEGQTKVYFKKESS